MEITCDSLVVILTLASHKLDTLIGRELTLENKHARAAHARELRIAVQVVLGLRTKLGPL